MQNKTHYTLKIGPDGAPDLYKFATREPIMPSDVTPELLTSIQEYVRDFQDASLVRATGKRWQDAHAKIVRAFEPFGGLAKRTLAEQDEEDMVDFKYPMSYRSNAAHVYLTHVVANYLTQCTNKYAGDIFDQIVRDKMIHDFEVLTARTGMLLHVQILFCDYVVDPVSKNMVTYPFTIVVRGDRMLSHFFFCVRTDESLNVLETNFVPVDGMCQKFDWITDYFKLYNY